MKIINKKYYDSPEKYIPVGGYCKDCVFYDRDESKPTQENGYCHYLKKGDWDLNKEFVVYDASSGKEVSQEDRGEIPLSLLWDGCKECGVNDYEVWCVDCKHATDFVGYSCYCNLKKNTVEDSQIGCESFKLKK